MRKVFLLSIISWLFIGCSSSIYQNTSLRNQTNLLNIESDFIWGINGHPVSSKDYLKSPIDQQIDLLKEHQLSYYRFDVRVDLEGEVIWYKDEFLELLETSNQAKIKLMPVILINLYLDEYQISENEAFTRGKNQMRGFVKRYGRDIDVYCLGNEQELRLFENSHGGQSITDYSLSRFKIVAAYLKGMIEGVKVEKPNAKTLINSSGGPYFGYFQLLEDYNVNYDILGYNWYSQFYNSPNSFIENIKVLYRRFNKPIWMTEVNRSHGSYRDYIEEQSAIMDYFMRELIKRPEIQAFFVYELYDQPSTAGKNLKFEQSEYGIVKWISPENIKYKPVSNVIKLNIEEFKRGAENYVQAIYFDLLGITPSQEELKYWMEKFKQLESQSAFLNEFIYANEIQIEQLVHQKSSKTDIQEYINSNYKEYLERNSKEQEVRFWNKQIKKKNPRLTITKTLLLSKEYWQKAIWAGYNKKMDNPL